jgi:hypothetical protein
MTAIVRTAMNIITSMMDMAGRTLRAYLLVSGEAQMRNGGPCRAQPREPIAAHSAFGELVSLFPMRGFG